MGLWWLSTKAIAAANLVFYPGNVSSMAFVGTTPMLVFTMQVENTSNTPLTINSFAGNAFANSTLIGNVYNFIPTIVPANGMALIPVNVQLQIMGLVSDIIRSFQTNNTQQNIEMDCTANVQGLSVPVKLNIAVGI